MLSSVVNVEYYYKLFYPEYVRNVDERFSEVSLCFSYGHRHTSYQKNCLHVDETTVKFLKHISYYYTAKALKNIYIKVQTEIMRTNYISLAHSPANNAMLSFKPWRQKLL
jgi:hypothetical protein